VEAISQSKESKLNLGFEYTAMDTPQQNSPAETSITNMANCGISLINAANVHKELRFNIWRETFQAATDFTWIITSFIGWQIGHEV
jgi:hypothetical protein